MLHSVFERAVHDQRRSLIGWTVGVAGYTAMIVVMYPMIRDRPDLTRVIDDLSAASGVQFQIEPGALQRVPPQYHNIRLDLENATVRQALEDIRGVTGLDYVVKPEGVYVWNQNPNSPGTPTASDPVVAMIPTDSGTTILLRESELPADVRSYLAHKRQDAIAKLRQQMKQEGFVPPTTQPASQPEAAK